MGGPRGRLQPPPLWSSAFSLPWVLNKKNKKKNKKCFRGSETGTNLCFEKTKKKKEKKEKMRFSKGRKNEVFLSSFFFTKQIEHKCSI